jgi:hypothetical protein
LWLVTPKPALEDQQLFKLVESMQIDVNKIVMNYYLHTFSTVPDLITSWLDANAAGMAKWIPILMPHRPVL